MEIQWKSYIDMDGSPILTLEEPPKEVPSDRELRPGENYLIPTLLGYVVGIIVFDDKGKPHARNGGSIYWLKKAADTWRSWGGGNLAAIQRLELQPMNKFGVELDDEKIKTAAAKDHVCPDCGRELMKDENGQYENRCPVHGTKPFEKRP